MGDKVQDPHRVFKQVQGKAVEKVKNLMKLI
jgi:hypothetical protein